MFFPLYSRRFNIPRAVFCILFRITPNLRNLPLGGFAKYILFCVLLFRHCRIGLHTEPGPGSDQKTMTVTKRDFHRFIVYFLPQNLSSFSFRKITNSSGFQMFSNLAITNHQKSLIREPTKSLIDRRASRNGDRDQKTFENFDAQISARF